MVDPTPQQPQTPSMFELGATPMARVEATLVLGALNPALRDWLGLDPAGQPPIALAALDAQPPALVDAARHALEQQRRVWLREARLRGALADRSADVALTPVGEALLLELLPVVRDSGTGLRLSETLRGFAHEVRGPLAGMRGAAQLLARHATDDRQRELAELVVAESDRLAALAQRLLDTGGKPHLAPHNIHEILERVAALAAADDARLHLRRDYDPSLPPVRVAADRMQQALLNLARNAQQAGARTLTLRTRIERGARLGGQARMALRIDVADDGCGVPANLAASVFEPLVSGRAEGSGLGLAIAREIAREHGGELDFVSRPGATVFSLLLPVAA